MVDGLFTCAICGKAHNTIAERAKCETACVIKAEEDMKKMKQEQLDAERKESEKAICDELSYVNELLANHYEKYKKFSINGSYPYLTYVFGRLPLWF